MATSKTVILQLILLLTCLLPKAHSLEEMFCAGTGYRTKSTSPVNSGLRSMGATPFYNGQFQVFWAMNHGHAHTVASGEQGVGMDIYHVYGKSASGTPQKLNGWLLLRIYSITTRHRIKLAALALWAETDARETTGYFMPLKNTCNLKTNLLLKNMVPCSATPINQPVNPNMVIYTNSGNQLATEMHVLWRGDTSYCHSPTKFRFRFGVNSDRWSAGYSQIPQLAVGTQQDYGPHIFETHWITTDFYGAASPLWEMECGKTKDSIHSTATPWILSKPQKGDWAQSNMLILSPKSPYYDNRWTPGTDRQILDVAQRRSVCVAQFDDYIAFGGRCKSQRNATTNWVYAKSTTVPVCNARQHASITQQFYDQFNSGGKRYSKLMQNCNICSKVPDKGTVSRAQVIDVRAYSVMGEGCFKENMKEKDYSRLGLCKNSVAGRKAGSVRSWHAITNLLNVMVLYPVSTFYARYLKGQIPLHTETGEPYLPQRTWYLVHFFLILPISCMYVTSVAAVGVMTNVLGRSRSPHAIWHKYFGDVIRILFACQMLTGLIRCINRFCRRIIMYIHWLCGYFVYYGGVVMCIMSYRIPASPLSTWSHLDPRSNILFFHVPVLTMMLWLAFDITIHVYTQVYVIKHDRKHLEGRIHCCNYFPIILPLGVDNALLLSDSHYKEKENRLWSLAYRHAAICVISFITMACIILYYNDIHTDLVGFGNMECTHTRDGKYAAGWHPGNESTNTALHKEDLCGSF